MAYEQERGVQQRRPSSVLQGDEHFFNRIISRNSSVGCSSRVFYYRSSEGIPFQWEMQPGTPKHPPKEEPLLPLCPPPAVISLNLPKPRFNDEPKPKLPSKSMRLRLWRNIKKNNKRKENNIGGDHRDRHSFNYEKEEFCSSDCEFIASPTRNSSSSSSSSSSSRSFSSTARSPARVSFRRPLSCSPWNVSAILVGIAKRV